MNFFSGIGVGPGDPELLTLKGLKRIQEADLIAYPAPENGNSLAREIAAPHIPETCAEYAVRIPILNNPNWPDQTEYDKAADDLLSAWRSGQNVAVLCEGDPFFYGSFMYLYERLSGQIPIEVIPGISSLTATPAVCGQPLVSHSECLTVLPATLPEDELQRRLMDAEATVILKTGRRLETVRRALKAAGLLETAQVAIHATMNSQRIEPLSQVTSLPYFATIIARRQKKVSG